MYVEQSSIAIWELIVTGVIGTVCVPFIIFFLHQNGERKNEISSSFDSIRQARDVDQKHVAEALGELRDRVTRLQTTVEIKKETVDKVQTEQIQAGVRIAVVEASIRAMTESQSRSEQNWIKVSDKLEVLGRIEETVKNLAEDMREVRAEQARKSE
jgi:uncharacterized membrane protein YhiD involved in acid resistance